MTGKKRRKVTWLSAGAVTHAFLGRQPHSACNGFSRSQVVEADPKLGRCRPCEIALAQLW